MREIQLHNSLTGKKEIFKPIVPGKVSMYVCGITVYDYCHIGHARSQLVFDMISRYLRAIGYQVTYVRNITDIDDKIIRRATENGEDFRELTERFTAAMNKDFTALGMQTPEHEPRATDYMDQIIAMIQALLDRKFAYAAENDDVYYDVSEFKPYGRLSGKKLEDLRAGARVEVDEAKADPPDFVLWKAAKPGEPSWDSPWGKGRPGWHIECSAMSTTCLGNHFDIHGGGMDLKFPHHENEIAQTCGASDAQFANYWLHNGFLQIDEEKMSKSLGNFFTVREVLEKYHPEVVRYFVLNSHYRSPLNYSDKQLDEAKSALDGLYLALRGNVADGSNTVDQGLVELFHQDMCDDFNTSAAISRLHQLATIVNEAKDETERAAYVAQLVQLGGILGLLQLEPEEYLQSDRNRSGTTIAREKIEALLYERDTARASKDFQRADEIRDELEQNGIIIEDGADGTSWRRK